jgi:acyl-CoA synthetase (AMP-forming)/AMP-acid ligase II
MGLRANAKKHPDKTAIVMVESGDTLRYPEFYAICFGALRSGLYYTAISTYLSPAETNYIVEDCGARLYISSAKFASHAENLAQILPAEVSLFSFGGEIKGYESIEAAVTAMPAEPIADETKGQDLLYSSGTTGQPKGVKIELTGDSPEVMSDNTKAVAGLYGFSPETIYLSPAPLYHAAPLRFNLVTMMLGGTSVIMRNFEPVAALQAIENYRCTHSQWVPTMFIRMLKLPEPERQRYDVSSMRVAIHAAAPCPVSVKERMIEWWGPVIHEYYAATEGNGFCAVASKDWLEHKGTVGRPLFGAVHILDDDGKELSPGKIGTIYFSGGTDFEYLNDSAKTRTAYNEEGWSTIGDVGFVDEDGYLYLTDRKSYMIISGGVNVYPQECENVLVMHPRVADAAVFGVPDEEMGEQVKAVVQLIDPADAVPDMAGELITYCRERLSPIKCPKSIDFIEALPRHATGKLYKRLLRDQYWDRDANPT